MNITLLTTITCAGRRSAVEMPLAGDSGGRFDIDGNVP